MNVIRKEYEMGQTKKNFIYNIMYQILALIIPLITAPYISRAVGVDGVGINSYTYSIVYYFMLFTLLGVNNYGNRTVAKNRDDKTSLSKTFWGIYIIQFIMGIIMLLTYIIFIYFRDSEYRYFSLLQSIYIVSSILDINWLFFGLEKFKLTIMRNTMIKILGMLLIFIFIKNEHDLYKYIIISSSTTLLSQILLWPFVRTYVGFSRVTKEDIIKHIKPNLILFIPVISVSLYKIMDKIMLGHLTNVIEVGYYENAEKIINIPMTIIVALGTVMLPKVSNLISNEQDKKSEKYMSKSMKFIMFISIPMSFGLISIAQDFVPLYFGYEFYKTGILIKLLAITIVFLSWANVIRTQYLIPREMDKEYIISVVLGAICNTLANIIFIPIYASIGACVGTIISEFVVMVYQTYILRKKLDINLYIKQVIPFLLNAIIMIVVIEMYEFIEINLYAKVILKIISACIIYFLLNFRYIDELINFKSIFKKLGVINV